VGVCIGRFPRGVLRGGYKIAPPTPGYAERLAPDGSREPVGFGVAPQNLFLGGAVFAILVFLLF
jgi:hypothetical protein